jgi:hypothetical protein
MTIGKPRCVRWSIIFDPSGLSAADTRMLSAVVEADLRLMRLAEDPADARSEEALVRRVTLSLTTRFPGVAFRLVRMEKDEP